MAVGRKANDKAVKALQKQAKVKAERASRAVGYVRVSTEDQAEEGSGLDYQREAIQSFAKSQGYELLTVVEDAGVSGASAPDSRPGFGRLLEMAKGGEFEILLVWKFDRLARHLAYAVTTTDTLRTEHGVAVRSVTEPLDTTTGLGQVIFSVLAGMAAMERESITRRTWEGRKAKAERGGFAGGQVPYGYKREEGRLVIDADEAEVVKRIFALRRAKSGVRAIASTLNREGISTRSGKAWNPATVAGILDNPRYFGHVDYLFGTQGMAKDWGVNRILREGEQEALFAPKARRGA